MPFVYFRCRNPLQAVVGSIGFLCDRFTKTDECYEDIATIATAAKDMTQVVDHISDWVKVSVGQLELKLERTTLQPMLQAIVRIHSKLVRW